MLEVRATTSGKSPPFLVNRRNQGRERVGGRVGRRVERGRGRREGEKGKGSEREREREREMMDLYKHLPLT